MERLTERTGAGTVILTDQELIQALRNEFAPRVREMCADDKFDCDHLCAGNILTEKCIVLQASDRLASIQADLVRLKAYEDEKEQGRVVVLPCKVGAPIWYIDVSIEPSERGSSKWTTRKRVKATKFDYSVLDWIDTPIYITRADAEAALKGEVDHEAD